MKKFEFTLQSVYEYKQTVERQRKADLRAAQEALRLLMGQLRALELSFERNAESRRRLLEEENGSSGIAAELEKHDAFFRFLHGRKTELLAEIAAAEEERDRIMALVIEIMKEVKVYKKLRDEQFARYMDELRKEEAKEIGDIVSFQTVTAETV